MGIASVIKERRNELGLTLKEIAEKIGVTEATVQRWEAGIITNLRYKRIIKLAEVLNIDPSVLMGWDASPLKQAAKERIWNETYLNALKSDDPVLKALVSAIDKRIKEIEGQNADTD